MFTDFYREVRVKFKSRFNPSLDKKVWEQRISNLLGRNHERGKDNNTSKFLGIRTRISTQQMLYCHGRTTFTYRKRKVQNNSPFSPTEWCHLLKKMQQFNFQKEEETKRTQMPKGNKRWRVSTHREKNR